MNFIVKRFEQTGVLPQVQGSPIFGDFASVPDYQAAIQLVDHAHAQFAGLSADLRAEFDNDPAKFLAFCSDPKNKDRMRQLGLLNEASLPPQAKPEATETGDGLAAPTAA